MIVAGYCGFSLDVSEFVRLSYVRPSAFWFPDDTVGKFQWIFTKFLVYVLILCRSFFFFFFFFFLECVIGTFVNF